MPGPANWRIGNCDLSCSLHGGTPIGNAYELSERMEASLREQIAGVDHILIHMEPLEPEKN